jgi:hypothetical protein
MPYRPSLEAPGAWEFDTPGGPMLARGGQAAELAQQTDAREGTPQDVSHYQAVASGAPPPPAAPAAPMAPPAPMGPMATSPGALAMGGPEGGARGAVADVGPSFAPIDAGVAGAPGSSTPGTAGLGGGEAPPAPAPAPAATPSGRDPAQIGEFDRNQELATPPEGAAGAPSGYGVAPPSAPSAPGGSAYGAGRAGPTLVPTPKQSKGGASADELRRAGAQALAFEALRPTGGGGVNPKARRIFEEGAEETLKAQDRVQQANEQMRLTNEARAADLSKLQIESEKTYQAGLEERRKVQEERERDFQARVDKATKEREGMKVDPNAFWANKTDRQKTMIAIGMALSGFAGGENTIAKMVSQGVDNAIKTQEKNIGVKDAEIGTLNSLHRESMKLFEDKEQAVRFTKVQAYQMMAAEAAQQALESGSPEAMARAEKIKADADQQETNFLVSVAQQRAGLGAKGGGGAAAGGAKAQKLFQAADQLDKAKGPSSIPFGNGTITLRRDLAPGDLTKVLDASVAANTANSTLDRIVEKGWSPNVFSDDNNEQKADASMLAYSVLTLSGQGQANKDQVDDMRGSLMSMSQKGGAKAVRDYIADRVDSYRRAYGEQSDNPDPAVSVAAPKAPAAPAKPAEAKK